MNRSWRETASSARKGWTERDYEKYEDLKQEERNAKHYEREQDEQED